MSKVLNEHEEAEFALNFTIKQLKEKNAQLRTEVERLRGLIREWADQLLPKEYPDMISEMREAAKGEK